MPKNQPVQKTREELEKEATIRSIAQNLSDLAGSVHSLLNGPLKRKSLIILLAHSSNLSQEKVSAVLTAMENLRKDFLN